MNVALFFALAAIPLVVSGQKLLSAKSAKAVVKCDSVLLFHALIFNMRLIVFWLE
jgi:hypothetical protein